MRFPIAFVLALLPASVFALDFSDSQFLRNPSPEMNAPRVRKLTLPPTDQGSTGDVSGMSTKPALAGTIARSNATRAAETFNVTDFAGVDPTGATNSLAGLIAAYNLVKAAGGGQLRFPCGSYLISGGTLLIAKSQIGVEGFNKGCTNIVNGNGSAPAIQFGDGTGFIYNNSLRNINCGGASGVARSFGNACVRFNKTGFATVSDVSTNVYPAPLYSGIDLFGINGLTMSNLTLTGTDTSGLYSIDSTDINILHSNANGNGGTGWSFTGTQGVYLTSVGCFESADHCFGMYNGGATGGNFNFYMQQALADSSGSDNWYIENLSNAICSNCWASTNKSKTVNPGASGFLLKSSRVFNVSFINPMAVLNNYAGFRTFDDGTTGAPNQIFVTNAIFGQAASPDASVNPAHPNGVGAFGGFGASLAPSSSITFTSGTLKFNQTAPIAFDTLAAGASAGTIRFRDVEGVNNTGPKSLAVTASPMTYKTGVAPETVCLAGGSVSNVSSGGITLLTSSNACIPLGAQRTIVLTYASAPTVSVMVQ